MRIITKETGAVVIDMQEKLMSAMHETKACEEKAAMLLKGLQVLSVPTVIVQQYTKGLGTTVPSIAEAIGDFTPVEKTSFSCLGEDTFVEAIEASDKGTVILAGIEAHICVEQTAIDLLRDGYEVAIVADCIQSRDPKNKEITLQRLAQAGAIVTSYESVLYELLGGAKAPEFKAISAIVK